MTVKKILHFTVASVITGNFHEKVLQEHGKSNLKLNIGLFESERL